jgi:hypothetical protein
MNKILCIDDSCWIQGVHSYVRKLDITIGKTYSIIEQDSRYYYIYDDKNSRGYYPKHCFTISDEIDVPKNLESLRQKELDNIEVQMRFDEEQRVLDNQRAISNEMDRFYNPQKFYDRRKRYDAFVNKISQVFVQGISYD